MSNRRLSLVVLSVLALSLTACGRAPTATHATSKKVVKSAAPSTAPTTATATSPAPDASPLPAESPAPFDPTRKVVVSGHIYNDFGGPADGVTVRVRSLVEAVPYSFEATTVDGAYVINDVPEGVNMEVVASKPGWTSRTRVAAFQAGSKKHPNTLDFGSQGNDFGAAATGYALSNHPEITRTEPVNKAQDVDPSRVSYQLTLSESLDEKNRHRLEKALRLLPANDAANAGTLGTTTDLATLESNGYPVARAIDGNDQIAIYALDTKSIFLEDPDARATVTWNASYTAATLSFPAPLIAANNEDAAYQVVLVSGGEPIRDTQGNQLGTDAAGSRDAYPLAGDWVLSPFKSINPVAKSVEGLKDGSAEALWAATHDNVFSFSVTRDLTDPWLEAVRTMRIGNDTVVDLRFSEPMAAYNGTRTGLVSDQLGDDASDLANYTFAVTRTGADMSDLALDGDAELEVDPTVTATFGGDGQRERAFRFAASAFAAQRTGAPVGSVVVALDPRDPRHVTLTIVERPHFFHAAANLIKVRTENLADPAGNAISGRDADNHTVTGTL